MRITDLEYKKSILMIFLLLLCVFQMGILWSDKNPGVPIPLLSQKFWPKAVTVNMDEIKNIYIRPERIMVSDGTDGYWPLNSKTEPYTGIWEDFMGSYLKQILEMPEGEKVDDSNWDARKKMKCIILEFKNPIPVGIIQWMTGTEGPVLFPLKQIHKIAIFPSEDINNNTNTLYLTDDCETVYRYEVTIEGDMKKEDYIYAIDTIKANSSIIPMRLVATYHPSIKNDELLAVLSDEKQEKTIKDLRVATPEEVILQRDNIDRIQEYLLDSGSTYTDLSDDETSVLFSDDEKVVRYYQNGFLDYQYRKRDPGAKGTVEEALEKALAFISRFHLSESRQSDLLHKVDIYLSEINSKNDNYYIFTLDYVMYDTKIKVLDESGKTVRSAITINANRERVLDVKWYIKTFEDNDWDDQYNLNFYDFNDKQLSLEYPELSLDQIQDISINYLYHENGMRAEPYWLVETTDKTDKKDIYLRMQGEGE